MGSSIYTLDIASGSALLMCFDDTGYCTLQPTRRGLRDVLNERFEKMLILAGEDLDPVPFRDRAVFSQHLCSSQDQCIGKLQHR